MYNPFENMGYINHDIAYPISIRNFCHEIYPYEVVTPNDCHHIIKKLGNLHHRHIFIVNFKYPINLMFNYFNFINNDTCIGVNCSRVIIEEEINIKTSRQDTGLVLESKHDAEFTIKENRNNEVQFSLYKGIIKKVCLTTKE